jgi:hypothetical protein
VAQLAAEGKSVIMSRIVSSLSKSPDMAIRDLQAELNTYFRVNFSYEQVNTWAEEAYKGDTK